jgi:hypothetical protein
MVVDYCFVGCSRGVWLFFGDSVVVRERIREHLSSYRMKQPEHHTHALLVQPRTNKIECHGDQEGVSKLQTQKEPWVSAFTHTHTHTHTHTPTRDMITDRGKVGARGRGGGIVQHVPQAEREQSPASR